MEGIQFDSNTKQLQLVQKEIPEADDNTVVIKVHYCGICGTDMHIINGGFPCRPCPVILGHEPCGVVEKVGTNVTHVKVGDRVVADPHGGCMACFHCRNGNPHYCSRGSRNSIGMFLDGAWAQYCRIPAPQVYQLPDSVTFEQATMCEPLSCLSHGLEVMAPLVIGQKILIIGAGIIGHLFAALLHLKGHRRVTVSETNEARIANIKKLNTNFNIIQPSALAESPDLFDAVIDCTGIGKAIEQAFAKLEIGGQLAIFGVPNPATILQIPAFPIMKKELSIRGLFVNPYSFEKALAIIDSMGDRYIDFDKLGVQTFALADYEKAIQSLRDGTVVKGLFKLI